MKKSNDLSLLSVDDFPGSLQVYKRKINQQEEKRRKHYKFHLMLIFPLRREDVEEDAEATMKEDTHKISTLKMISPLHFKEKEEEEVETEEGDEEVN